MGLKTVASRKISFGKVAMPAWTMAIAVALVGAAAGQAVGPILSGSTSGDISATVSQSITVDTDTLDLTERITITGSVDDAVATTNDEGTHFTVAFENNVGDTARINIFLTNRSDVDASAKLFLDVPAGVDVEVTSAAGSLAPTFAEAQLSRNTWLLTVDADSFGDDFDDVIPTNNGNANMLTLIVEPEDDFKPGFYQITGRIVQTEG